jgi:hypothetical protein
VCPQCGSADQVHSIEEWAAMAQANMGHQWQSGAPMPAYPAQPTPTPGYAPGQPTPQPGYAPGQPTPPVPSGFPDPSQYQQPGYAPGQPTPSAPSGFPDPSQYQQSGFPDPSQYQQPGAQSGAQQQPPPAPAQPQQTQQPGPQPAQQPGYQPGPTPPGYQPGQTPPGYQPGPTPQYLPGPESWQSQPPPRRRSWDSGGGADSIEDAIGEAVLGAATKAIGRVLGRKMRQAYNEKIAPAMAARADAVLNERVAIAQRHPDLRACLRDQVVFLIGGTRVLPLAAAMKVRTVEQSDALVAQLRG